MLTFRELSEKKSKIKINPKQADLTEKSKHGEDCECQKCEEKEDKKDLAVESVDLTEEWINASIEVSADYFFAEGINEDGLDQIIDEVGLEDFVNFVIDPIEELNEERSARKASVKAPSYEKVKAAVDKSDAAKKKTGKGEYSKSYPKRSGETEDSTNYNDKAPAKKKAKPVAKATVRKPKAAPKKKAATVKKVEKAVKTAKKTQPQKPTSKKGLLGKVGDAVKKGVERHNKARAAGKVPEKRVKEFAKGFKKGVSGTLKFAGKVKKAVSEETVDEMHVTASMGKHAKEFREKKAAAQRSVDQKSEKSDAAPVEEGVGDAVKKGVKRHKDAVEKKKIKNRKAVPYAALAAEHKPEGEMVEATRLKKEKGYDKGGTKKPSGKPTALSIVLDKIKKEHGAGAVLGQGGSRQKKKDKGAKSSSGTGKYLKRAQDKKAYVAKAKKAGFKSAKDYTNTVARYGSEDNYKKGKGLGT